MASNQAAWIDGKAGQFRIADAEMWQPEAGEVLIKNAAVAVNPVDWKIQDSGYFIQTWPNILGCDIAGEVVEVGADVKNVKKGDRVIAHVISLFTQKPKHGAFQKYAVAQAATTAKIPDSVSFAEGSVLPLALDTAATALFSSSSEAKGLGLSFPSLNPSPSGKTVVIWGGSSSVGALAIQLAVAAGAHVVAVASSKNHAFCQSLGASDVFDYNSNTVSEDVTKSVQASKGEFAGVFDAISLPDSYKLVLPIFEQLKTGGILATTLGAPEKVPEGVKAVGVFAVNPVTYPLWADYVTPALEQGKLKCVPEPLIVGKGLEHVQAGLDANKKGVSAKKVVIEF